MAKTKYIMNNPAKFILTLFVLLSIVFPVAITGHPVLLADEEDREALIGRYYFEAVHQAISEAKDSIDVAMYFIIAEPADRESPINILVDDLIKAKNRGVKVRVILEDGKFKENHLAYKQMRAEGIEVNFDSPRFLLHSKVVVIDREICIAGSANWSTAALEHNHEVSFLIHSKAAAERLLQSISKIELRPDVPVLPSELKGISLRGDFLLSSSAGRMLLKNRAEKQFDLYLLLLKELEGKGTDGLAIDYETLARALGYSLSGLKSANLKYRKTYYYEKVRKPLVSLARIYKLISYDPDDKTVSIIPLPSAENYFILPYRYWEYGLSGRLSLRAKYVYLISLLEAEKSTKRPYWFRSQADLANLYGISEYTISLGLQELERENILEVNRSISEKGKYGRRPANIYCNNPLMTEEVFEDKIAALEAGYGEEITGKAQMLSAELNEPKDLLKIETYIRLIREYGFPRVRQANKRTRRLKKGSGLYDISNTIQLLK